MTFLSRLLLLWCCWSGSFFAEAALEIPGYGGAASGSIWDRLRSDAEHLHLPTQFLKAIPPDFLRIEFDDLRTYAAEYHPGEHRMVLNRSLSFNSAGRTLKPLAKMTHKELEVLYHELFHAYMDYLVSLDEHALRAGGMSNDLMSFARRQQVCRYGAVVIVPVAQRQQETELRYLTESESWEALNETWAVFIGWAIWNQLEVQEISGRSMFQQPRQFKQWARRLETAIRNGEFRGYYVPEDSSERRITQKRFLARQSQLTWQEIEVLISQVLGFHQEFILSLGRSLGSLKHTVSPSGC